MELDVFKQIAKQFYELGGIKMMITGGEPLMHPEIEKILGEVTKYGIRVEILTNGTLINRKNADLLKKYVDEVQVSIDGVKGHDMLRGEGSLEKTLGGIESLEDMDLTIATMVTGFNCAEFDEIEKLVLSLGAKRWLLDYPCTDDKLLPKFKEAAGIIRRYGFGKESYESSLNKTCGTHLCAVTPTGMVSRCGFYGDKPVGSIEEGLRECWDRICRRHLWDIDELECQCKSLESCRGGCRYRAEYFGYGRLGKDPLMCHYFEEE
jgi:radical SAM protein with 4Fe4S-binding SPASM domain